MSHTFNIAYQFGSVLTLNHECGIVFLVDTATQYQLGCDDVRLFVSSIAHCELQCLHIGSQISILLLNHLHRP